MTAAPYTNTFAGELKRAYAEPIKSLLAELFVWYEPDVNATPSTKTYRRKFEHLEPDEEYFAFISPSQGTATLWDSTPKMVFGRDNQR